MNRWPFIKVFNHQTFALYDIYITEKLYVYLTFEFHLIKVIKVIKRVEDIYCMVHMYH